MDLSKSGILLRDLRIAKGLTQKQLADILGVVPKTVSKWETGHGFPDTSLLLELSKILNVSIDSLLSGSLSGSSREAGNMKKIKFYVCPRCGGIMYGIGNGKVFCCGMQLSAQKALKPNLEHASTIVEDEDEYLITFSHEMKKDHYIDFISYVKFDAVLVIKLYPEQDSSVRFPKLRGGKFFIYCTKHGLFEYDNKRKTDN